MGSGLFALNSHGMLLTQVVGCQDAGMAAPPDSRRSQHRATAATPALSNSRILALMPVLHPLAELADYLALARCGDQTQQSAQAGRAPAQQTPAFGFRGAHGVLRGEGLHSVKLRVVVKMG